MNDNIILLKEGIWESVARDTFSVLAAFALLLPGWFIESGWLSFFGGAMLILIISNRALGVRKKYERTPEEAIAEIQKIIDARNAE